MLMMGRGCNPNPVMKQMGISVCYQTFCLVHVGFLPMHKVVSEGTVSVSSLSFPWCFSSLPVSFLVVCSDLSLQCFSKLPRGQADELLPIAAAVIEAE